MSPRSTFARGLAATIVAAGLLTAPAQAADSLDPGANYIHGSEITLGVSGAATRDGAIAVRFAHSPFPLFWGNTGMDDMDDHSATALGISTGGVTYAGVNPTYSSTQFTQTAPPVASGTGTLADPWVVVNAFSAGPDLTITQTVEHVNGTGGYSAEWAITNNGISPAAMKVYYGGDTEIPYLANNVSTLTGTSPSRVIANVGPDGARVELHERTPWTHYFAGQNAPFGQSTRSFIPSFNYNDAVDATAVDAGLGAQWTLMLAPGVTETLAVDVNIVAPPLSTVAPVVTGAEDALTTVTSAAPSFVKGAGDTVSTTFECQFDGGAWAACVSPRSFPNLADGAHSFSVRGVNSANLGGATTTRTWTVDTTAPFAPVLGDKPDLVTKRNSAAFTITGEQGATFMCALDSLEFTPCESPYRVSALADGSHTVLVRQTDRAGNVGVGADRHTWTVDTSVPAPPAPPAPPACTSLRVIDLSFKVPARLKPSGFVVKVDGRSVSKLKRSARKARVSLVGRPAGAVKVQVVTTGKKAKVVTTRSFRTCSPGPAR